MAEHDYVRLAAACHCGQPARSLTGAGRPPKTCDEHRRPPVTEPEKKECPACRGFFMPNAKGGHEQTYCSRTCGYRFRRGCKPRDEKQTLECRHCKAAFDSAYPEAMYCTKKCKTAAWHANNPERSKELRLREQRQRPEATLCAYIAKACKGCGKADGKRREWELCSGCLRSRALSVGRLQALITNQAKHKAIARVVLCVGCDCEYCPLYGVKLAATCPSCEAEVNRERQRASKDRRDKRLKCVERETIHKAKVFARDGWRCQLCGIGTPKDLRGTYAHNAPELDHIVPVSRGGAHTYANTQCLCRSCNGWKAARTMDEAMAALEG